MQFVRCMCTNLKLDRGCRDCIVGKILALHVADLGSILGTNIYIYILYPTTTSSHIEPEVTPEPC